MVSVTGNTATFRFLRPGAASVHLAGSFNGWRSDELKMVSTGDGWWEARLTLPPGEYRFRYLADGRWFADFAAFGVKEGEHGLDSILWLPRPAQVA